MTPDERQREASELHRRLQAAIVESAADAILSQNWDGVITSWNSGAERMLGYTAAQIVGQHEAIFVPQEFQKDLAGIRYRIRRGEPVEPFEAAWRTREGKRICVSLSTSPVWDESGTVIGVGTIARDITARKEAEARTQHLAYFDALTDLPNRTLLQDRLHQAVALAKRQNRLLAVHFLDLDHFKAVNDLLGHDQGDALLRGVADRLQRAVRASDTVARIAGDEFAIVQTDLSHTEGAATLAQRLLAVVAAPFLLNGQTIRPTASIGIAVYPKDNPSGDQLLQSADRAMYLAKQKGRNNFCFFSETTTP
jgi:diguanylate cyclase (GGDEF)-like protein/PAS domain S-box-containing protein